jgi:hypothetical protein
MNGGTCIDELLSYRCVCPPDFQGARCEDSTGCTLKADLCVGGAYCAFDKTDQCGTNGERGSCKLQPAACIDLPMPICGCDAQNYDNPCRAALKAISVAHEGPCQAKN